MTFAISKELQFLAGQQFYVKLTAMASCPPSLYGGRDAHPTRVNWIFFYLSAPNYNIRTYARETQMYLSAPLFDFIFNFPAYERLWK
ncbi:hypothetical protein NIES25_22210 [Nostoc linckia NIES-25]|nr:hypothetical protein NIES25_22210 [Nostoc linckia NIES-25]